MTKQQTSTTAIPATMRALVLSEYGTMTVQERPTPTPGPGEALLRVLYTGICGSDLHGYTGENGRRFIGQIMGHETVAQIAALGDGDAGGLDLDDLVTVNPTIACGKCRGCSSGRENICQTRQVIGVDPSLVSAFAQYMVVAVHNVVPLNSAMPAPHGALIEPLAVGYHAAVRGGVKAGDEVLVIGAGPIGQACALAAQRLGASRVLVSETSPSRRALIEGMGLPTYDPSVADADGQHQPPSGFAVTIDAVGSTQTMAAAFAATLRGGSIVLVGMQAPEISVPAYGISTEERSVHGAFCYSDEEFIETAEWAATVAEDLDPLISNIVALDDAPAAFKELAESPDGASKVLVQLNN